MLSNNPAVNINQKDEDLKKVEYESAMETIKQYAMQIKQQSVKISEQEKK